MLSKELYAQGQNLSQGQLAYSEQWARDGAWKIRTGRIERPYGSVALLARKTIGSNGRYSSVDLRSRLIVPIDAIEFVLVTDHAAAQPTPQRKIESLALMSALWLDDDLAPVVGGSADHCRLKIDFARSPLMPGQSELRCRGAGVLKSPTSGKVLIQHLGREVDICVGHYVRGASTRLATVVYRIAAEAIESGAAELLVGTLPAEPGLAVETDVYVELGQPLVRLHRTVDYRQAQFDDRGPVFEKPKGRTLIATKLDYLAALNKMNADQNDLVLPGDEPVAQVDPATWCPRVLFEVRGKTVQTESGIVEIDPLDLTKFPGFTPTPALVGDLLRAVGPHGDLKARAAYAGIVQQVAQTEDALVIDYDDDRRQELPACAAVDVAVGAELQYGDVIGDLVPRVAYNNVALLAEVAGGLQLLVREQLRQTGVMPGADGWRGGVLYDWAYLPPSLTQYLAATDGQSGVYVDLRRGAEYYLDTAHGFVYPPLSLPNPDEPVLLGRVLYDFREPVYVPPSDESVVTRAAVSAAAA